MTTKTDGGEAFPYPSTLYPDGTVHEIGSIGLSKRDYFAAKAMQGICASNPSKEWTDERIADEAYRLADAMLKAKEQA